MRRRSSCTTARAAARSNATRRRTRPSPARGAHFKSTDSSSDRFIFPLLARRVRARGPRDRRTPRCRRGVLPAPTVVSSTFFAPRAPPTPHHGSIVLLSSETRTSSRSLSRRTLRCRRYVVAYPCDTPIAITPSSEDASVYADIGEDADPDAKIAMSDSDDFDDDDDLLIEPIENEVRRQTRAHLPRTHIARACARAGVGGSRALRGQQTRRVVQSIRDGCARPTTRFSAHDAVSSATFSNPLSPPPRARVAPTPARTR